MTCKITVTTRTVAGYSHRADSPLEVVSRCETHNMPITEPHGMGELCPIGKIELATEMALRSISRHIEKSWANLPDQTGDHGC